MAMCDYVCVCVCMRACEFVSAFMRGIRSTFIQDKCTPSLCLCLSLPLSHLILSISSLSKEINQASGVAIRHHEGKKRHYTDL